MSRPDARITEVIKRFRRTPDYSVDRRRSKRYRPPLRPRAMRLSRGHPFATSWKRTRNIRMKQRPPGRRIRLVFSERRRPRLFLVTNVFFRASVVVYDKPPCPWVCRPAILSVNSTDFSRRIFPKGFSTVLLATLRAGIFDSFIRVANVFFPMRLTSHY